MLASFRTALLICGALIATTFTPARAGPSAEPLISIASATLPKVSVPDLLDPQAEPELTAPANQDIVTPDQAPADDLNVIAEPSKATGDLSEMVAQLRGSDAGSRELECLATGIYFESKS